MRGNCAAQYTIKSFAFIRKFRFSAVSRLSLALLCCMHRLHISKSCQNGGINSICHVKCIQTCFTHVTHLQQKSASAHPTPIRHAISHLVRWTYRALRWFPNSRSWISKGSIGASNVSHSYGHLFQGRRNNCGLSPVQQAKERLV
jgi:hypothetical protein